MQRSSTLWHTTLRDKLGQLLKQYDPRFPGGLVVQRLELALGDIPVAQFELHFSARLLRQLEIWLQQQLGSNADHYAAGAVVGGTRATDTPRGVIDEESSVQAVPDVRQLCPAFIYYLQGGYWPWPTLWQKKTPETSPVVAQDSGPGHWLCQQLTTEPQKWLPQLAMACLQGISVQRLHWLLTAEARQQLCSLFWPDAPAPSDSRPLPGMLTLHALHWLLTHPSRQTLPTPQMDVIEALNSAPLAVLRQALHILLAREEHLTKGAQAWALWRPLLISAPSALVPPKNSSPISVPTSEIGDNHHQQHKSTDFTSDTRSKTSHPEPDSQHWTEDNSPSDKQTDNRHQPHKSTDSTSDTRSKTSHLEPDSQQWTEGNSPSDKQTDNRHQPHKSTNSATAPMLLSRPIFVPRQDEPISVAGAGLILCWAMLPALFNRLWPGGMDTFARHQAVMLLDWLLWQDEEEMAEWRMTFLRILCDLALETPLMAEAQTTQEQRQEVGNWMDAVAAQLPLPVGLSVAQQLDAETVRRFFLQRQGELLWQPEGWVLRIKQEGWDILLARLPWPLDGMTISAPLLPWLEMPLTIEWPIPDLPFF